MIGQKILVLIYKVICTFLHIVWFTHSYFTGNYVASSQVSKNKSSQATWSCMPTYSVAFSQVDAERLILVKV